MPLLETGVRTVTGRMPKLISPQAHAVADYAIAASLFVMGALLWKRKRRAAITAIAYGTAELATAMITDYPGGVSPMISFETQGRIDAALATAIGSMPIILDFASDREALAFRTQGIVVAAVTGLTDFQAQRKRNLSEWAA